MRSPNLDSVPLSRALIDYPTHWNFRQPTNGCGPYSAAAVMRTFSHEEIDSKLISREMSWRLPNEYTLPWGIEAMLKSHDISISTPILRYLSDESRLLFLELMLSEKHPVILLGELSGIQHYVTILGFDSDLREFYLYDSVYPALGDGMTKDGNGSLPGNQTLSYDELLEFWGKGGMYGFYRWYALVAKN